MKIFIANNNAEVGGIQKSLVNLLREISEKHEVTLFLFNDCGELKADIPRDVKVISGNRFTRILGMSRRQAKEKSFICGLYRDFCVIASKVFGTKVVYNTLCKMQKIDGHFDCAISFMQNSGYRTFYGGCNELVLNSVNADKKAAFVHCDFEKYPGNNEYNRTFYQKFDTVACVSHSTKAVFDRVCPNLAEKTETVCNVYDFESMSRQAETEIDLSQKRGIMLFTSARISPEKGIMRMLPILARIKEKGREFTWYIAGDGPEYQAAKDTARAYGLVSDVVFLGMIKNPYPYFKRADMVLVPSYNEAAPMVFYEAVHFATPVFTTDTTSAKELIGERFGWVTENDDTEIEKKLNELLINPEKIKEKKITAVLDNKTALEQFENILR